MKDDARWMDELQREANRSIVSVLPFNPELEMQQETDIADPPPEPPVGEIDTGVVDDLCCMELDPFDDIYE